MRPFKSASRFVVCVCALPFAAAPARADCPCAGDVNGDLFIDARDIQAFVDCIVTGSSSSGSCSGGDMDCDGIMDGTDVTAFASTLLSVNCAVPCNVDRDWKLRKPGSWDRSPLTPDWRDVLKSLLDPGGIVIARDGLNSGARPAGAAFAIVSAATGEFRTTGVDLDHLEAFGDVDFMWGRCYGSRTGPNTAQGNGWDFCFNIWIEPFGQDMGLHNGWGRVDQLYYQPDGTWSRYELFGVLNRNLDASFTWTFPNAGAWSFRPLDGTATQGRLSSIRDRNGNSLTCAYDTAGRLTGVTDSLGRALAVGYNAEGYIASVTDYAGRLVRYDYYHNGDAGGSAGDLKSVTSPAVTGTPNGNDFPLGKTVVFTYSKGFADERLNHNLLTITDPLGHVLLNNTYSSIPDSSTSHQFDWLVHVDRPLMGPMDLYHVSAHSVPSLQQVTGKTIVNDGAGNVREYYHDYPNRIVLRRDYTGRADPNQPTTETTNRPGAPLRGDDPPYFDTLLYYNDDSLPTRIVLPNLNEKRCTYDSLNPDARARGNLLQVCALPGPLGGDQTQICNTFQYEPTHNMLVESRDALGHILAYSHNSNGNLTSMQDRIPTVVHTWEYNSHGQTTSHVWPDNGSGHHRRDEFAYYPSGQQQGYLASVTVDAGGIGMVTQYEHDAVGNVVRMIDPRGHDTLLSVNALNQVVRVTSRTNTDLHPFRVRIDLAYDADDGPSDITIQNLDDEGGTQLDGYLDRIFFCDGAHRLIRIDQEVDSGHRAVTEFGYDANGNRSLVRKGEAVNGNQPANVVRAYYDERDLLYRIVRGEGDPAASTTQYDYDGNGHRRAIRQGIESDPRITLFAFDGFGRPVQMIDPMGNIETTHYDANDNAISRRFDGELLDVPGSAGNVRLAESTFLFDPMDRLTELRRLFGLSNQTPVGDGLQITQYYYNDCSQLTRVLDDNSHATQAAYDGAGRLQIVVDARGNTITRTYDQNSNVVGTVEVEKSDLGGPDVSRTTSSVFNNLDRLIQTTDSGGRVVHYGYDSRGNLLSRVDPRGNTSRSVYDGLGRVTQSAQSLTDTGDGGGSVIGTAVTTAQYDDSSRLVASTDADGNVTMYVYDALDRRTRTIMADGTMRSCAFDVHDNPTTCVDANGTSLLHAYDLLNRLTTVNVVPAAGVSSITTHESFAYDGLSRCTHAEDDDSRVDRIYDSLSNIVAETQQVLPNGLPRTITRTVDAVGNLTRLAYPGGRLLDFTRDSIDRVTSVADAGSTSFIARAAFLGPVRLAQLDYANGTQLQVSWNADRQVQDLNHSVLATGESVSRWHFDWDGAHNKIIADNQAPIPQDRLFYTYQFDSLNRLSRSELQPAGQIITYSLDHVGNRTTISGGPDAGAYLLDATMPAPADRQVNQYTDTPSQARHYDDNGNLVRIDPLMPPAPPRLLAFDAHDQLVQFTDQASGVSATYRHDALGRRIEKNVGGVVTRYLYLANHVIEEQDASGETLATYSAGCDLDGDGFIRTMRRCSPPTVVENQTFSAPPMPRWSFLGTASFNPSGGSARLVATGQQNSAGVAYFSQPIVSDYFQVEFDFSISNLTGGLADFCGSQTIGPDGLTLFVTGAPPPVPGDPGRGLGYNGMASNSFAMEFDGFCNPAYLDPDSNHVGLDVGGNVAAGSLVTAPVSPDFETPGTWHAWMRCKSGQVQVYLRAPGGSPFLALTCTVPPANVPAQKFIGFSAGSGVNSADVDIDNVTIKLLTDCNTAPQADYYMHTDDLGSVRKITDASGAVVEQYKYSDFGRPSAFDPSGAPLAHSQIGNNYLFHGEIYDIEPEMSFTPPSVVIRGYDRSHRLSRGRMTKTYDPGVGRYICREWEPTSHDEESKGPGEGGMFSLSLGNRCAYAGDNAVSRRDYCVQYRESDFDFARRLMEEEGIYYFFQHTDGRHILTIANGPRGRYCVPELDDQVLVCSATASSDDDDLAKCPARFSATYNFVWSPSPSTGSSPATDKLRITLGPNAAGGMDTKYWCTAVMASDRTGIAPCEGVGLTVRLIDVPSSVNVFAPIFPPDHRYSLTAVDSAGNAGAPVLVDPPIEPYWVDRIVIFGEDPPPPAAPVTVVAGEPLTSGTFVRKSSGGCGATGAEAIPFFIWWLRAKRRQRR